MSRVKPGDLALFQAETGKRAILRLEPDKDYQTHRGIVYYNDVIGLPWGSQITTHLGMGFTIFQPTLRDLLLHIRRQSQIIFPKDIGYIILRLSAGPGKRVLEVGTGSGALTTALAWMVGDSGQVTSYDRRKDMQDLARQNLARLGLEQRVNFILRDVEQGLEPDQFQAAFTDVPNPERLLPMLKTVLDSGAVLGAILPTMNQVDRLLESAPDLGFMFPEVMEILMRSYKTTPGRLRPLDRMVAHTGYLVFFRHMA